MMLICSIMKFTECYFVIIIQISEKIHRVFHIFMKEG